MTGEIRRLGGREVYRTPWMTVREDEVEFPSGLRGTYSVVDKTDFVTVLPFTGDGFWLVQQYRYPVGSREWEFPQGGWPAGQDGPAAELAAKELREETGFTAGRMTHLGRLFAAYGYCSQSFDVYLAEELTAGATEREDTEQDMISEWRSVDELYAMIRGGQFRDAHSVAALGLLNLAVVSGS
ncbi:MAG TPA: NUDIX hydrolase [Jatrophihabitans sp.]|jgi:8-oxo-dGTP pyrophosphatase MutT (NUDIX family)|nr:NUDIX hydrolase [Jatrophihabitans sp.]